MVITAIQVTTGDRNDHVLKSQKLVILQKQVLSQVDGLWEFRCR